MAGFADPFPGISREINEDELVRALRLDIAAEEEAVTLYTAQADATRNPIARRILNNIAEEEIVHIGEFNRLIEMISKPETKLQMQGQKEVDEMVTNFSIDEVSKWLNL